MALDVYNRKRDFAQTTEPPGLRQAPQDGLRFVVQHHIARADHYDLRLEWDGALLSWAVPKGPSYNTGDKRLAVMVEDHPLEYRHFEGTIPKGEYGGGTVMLWDEGFWQPAVDVDGGLQDGSLKFTLYGRRLKGRWALVRLRSKDGDGKDNWLMLKERDSYVQDTDGISGFDTSIRTGRTMAQIEAGQQTTAAKNPFDAAPVQLAKLTAKPPEGDSWLWEIKYDGYRIVAYVEAGAVRLVTRGAQDYAARFPTVAAALLDLAQSRAIVLDGELCAVDEAGRTDFQALQRFLNERGPQTLRYIVFDLLALDGDDLRALPLTERKEKLEALLADGPDVLHYSRHVAGHGEQSFAAAERLGMEGIVGKRADSRYTGTRNGDWVKVKCKRQQPFVIGGYTRTEKRVSGLSALLLGLWDGDELRYAGRVGTGFTNAQSEALAQKFVPLQQPHSPFADAPKERKGEVTTWLTPSFVADVAFAEWTADGRLRHTSYKGLRDIDAKSCAQSPPQRAVQQSKGEAKPMATNAPGIVIEGVKISSPDKVLFQDPAVKKLDVIRYYEAIARRMLPHVQGRLLSIVRCPRGVGQACFYKKHPDERSLGIGVLNVTGSDGQSDEYYYIENGTGLIWEAQMGTLEFHTWGSRADRLEQPDRIVFDLDPDEGMELAQVRQGVRDTKAVLDELGLACYLKTSGGKGYHIVVPVQSTNGWQPFSDFARGVADVLAARFPDRYTANSRKNKRTGKIFIDWQRNTRGATSIAPYSLRARAGASVSMPIPWHELDTVPPDGIGIAEALARLDLPDPWVDIAAGGQRIQ